jgi:hypothetical protein
MCRKAKFVMRPRKLSYFIIVLLAFLSLLVICTIVLCLCFFDLRCNFLKLMSC